MSAALDTIRETIASVFRTVAVTGNTELIITPWMITPDENLTVYVERVGDDLYTLCDEGQVWHMLADNLVDVHEGQRLATWKKIKAELTPPPFTGEDDSLIITSSDLAGLGDAVTQLASVAVRLSAFQALGPRANRDVLRVRMIQSAEQAGLTVEPNVSIPNQYGGQRTVTFAAGSGAGRAAVLARTPERGGGFNEIYDRARGVFDGAQIPLSRRVLMVDSRAKVLPWHRDGLADVCTLVDEAHASDLWEKVGA